MTASFETTNASSSSSTEMSFCHLNLLTQTQVIVSDCILQLTYRLLELEHGPANREPNIAAIGCICRSKNTATDGIEEEGKALVLTLSENVDEVSGVLYCFFRTCLLTDT